MNACNLTSALVLEKGTVWLSKISVINPLRRSFIISSSIRTAQQISFWTTVAQSWAGWIPEIPSLIVTSCLQIVGEEWLCLHLILPFREDQPRNNSWKENYIAETICMTTNGLKKDNSSILPCFVVLLALKANAKNTDQQNSLSDIDISDRLKHVNQVVSAVHAGVISLFIFYQTFSIKHRYAPMVYKKLAFCFFDRGTR